ncbi:RNA polymerase II transcription factor B subunit 1 [Cladophialophora chaetospira]|uniref:RNA polymerase II transcription factor B subunit 1 n=1 Tax=Cladophialophora chaetospira TaxID=386627 RepID=A0AA38XIV9_9EURO|nr:RNA polymerase II transcription factor B subunit 1 [Cladophialophora chaetospira]
MAPPQGQATYKKLPGILAISKDRKSVSWTPTQPPDASPSLVLSATTITNLQQTPETNPKVMLKIFTQNPGQTEAVSHVFTFTSTKDPRSEANGIKDALANVIQAQKAAQNAATTSSGGQSGAMTIANAISGGGRVGNLWEDDDRLKSDARLQQSLLQANPELARTYKEALNFKPDSLSKEQFIQQFWSSRVHLLRAQAMSKTQEKGTFNVLAGINKGESKLSLRQDQIRAIFEQYPVMRIVYDDLVPRKIPNEADFWSKFFQSQLHLKLRGLKFDPVRDAKDLDIDVDRYMHHPLVTGLRPTATEMHIPKFIDLEGNEENHFGYGNRPEFDLRPNNLDKAPVIRKLNAISEKLMAAVRPSDVDASAPIGMGETAYEQLKLRDLEGEHEQQRVILNIRDQSRFFSDNQSAQSGAGDANPFRNLDPAKAVEDVNTDIAKHFSQPGVGVIPIANFEEEDEEEMEEDSSPKTESGSSIATKHILSLIQANRDQTASVPESSNLSPAIYDRLTLTHATTIEFLRQFWSAFLSGDASRANEVASLVESLNRALDRINIIIEDAEKERQNEIKKAKQEMQARYEKTGRRRALKTEDIKSGGGHVVRELLGPIMKSLSVAVQRYKQAFEEQTKNMGEG